GFQPHITYESSQWDLITELVDAELGITILPLSVYSKINNQNIKMIPLEDPPVWQLNIITKKDSYHSYSVKALFNFIIDNFNIRNFQSIIDALSLKRSYTI